MWQTVRPLPCHLGAAIVLLLPCMRAAEAGEPVRPCQARWIWAQVQSPGPFQFVRFRKTVDLASRPDRLTAYITADTFYRLWVNGRLAMHGPARSIRGTATIDPVDLAGYVVPGKNTLMVEAFHGPCRFEALAQAPGMLCELEAETRGRKTTLAPTDDTWEASEIAAWSRESLRFNFQRGWMEQFDARRVTDEKPRPASVLGKVGIGPWKTVEMRDIPLPAPLAEVQPVTLLASQSSDGFVGDFHGPETRIEPRAEWDQRSAWFRRLHTEHLKIDAAAVANPEGLVEQGRGEAVLHGNGSSATYDFARGYVGFIGFEVTGKAGQVVEIAWSDQLSAEGDVRPCAQTGRNALQYILREGRQRFLAFTPQFLRFLRVVARGDGPLVVHRLWITEFRFDAQPKGGLVCSDEGINQVYEAARWTAALNTLDAYMDCPHRERNAMYGVEGYWMQKAVYPLFGDTRISRRSILFGAASVDDPAGTAGPPDLVHVAYPMHLEYFNTVIPTQPLFWVLHAGLYQRCADDTQFIREMLPAIRRNLTALDGWRNAEGLLESIPGWMFFDYARIRVDGVSVALNAVYARTLDEASRLEHLAGDSRRADQLADLARRVRQSLNRLCPGDGFYPDVLVRNGQSGLTPSREACETTQYYVLWGNVPPPERKHRMWLALRDDFLPTPRKKVEPIQGLTRAGLYPFLERLEVAAELGDHAALVRDAKAMFLPMVHSSPGTLWEDPMGRIALCHSIGCGVAGILTEEVLGIRLGFPLEIAPHGGGALRWCRGYITTPRGRIGASWKWQADCYQLEVALPEGTVAEVRLPPEAKAVWEAGPSKSPWTAALRLRGTATVLVTPGNVRSTH
jgi:hypothetical protein